MTLKFEYNYPVVSFTSFSLSSLSHSLSLSSLAHSPLSLLPSPSLSTAHPASFSRRLPRAGPNIYLAPREPRCSKVAVGDAGPGDQSAPLSAAAA